MVFKTLREAYDWNPSELWCSWRSKVIIEHAVRGRTYYSAWVHDAMHHNCRACRNSSFSDRRRGNDRRRLPCTGHTCPQCGNPYAAFTRQGVQLVHIQPKSVHQVMRGAWTDTGKLH